LSVAFTKEDSAETASETLLPDRPVSPHPNLVAETGLKALEFQLHQAREAYEAAQNIEDVNERRRQAAIPLRDMRYFAARVRTAQVITNPASTDTVAFGSTVTFRRDDGRVQKYRIVGEDEADPKAGSISFVSPVARLLMGRPLGMKSAHPVKTLRSFRSRSTSRTGRSRCLEWPLCANSGHSRTDKLL
jgi:transcription elongation GreA/GreB family factor